MLWLLPTEKRKLKSWTAAIFLIQEREHSSTSHFALMILKKKNHFRVNLSQAACRLLRTGKENGRKEAEWQSEDTVGMDPKCCCSSWETSLKWGSQADVLLPLLSFFIACRHVDLIVGSFSWYVRACARVDPRDLELGWAFHHQAPNISAAFSFLVVKLTFLPV